jgi:hypothetical protein
LQIDQVCECDGGDCEGDAFGAYVVGEDLGVEDDAGNVNAAAIEEQEDVEGGDARA